VTPYLRTGGPSVFKITHFKISQLSTQIWRLAKRTGIQKQFKLNWLATKTENSNFIFIWVAPRADIFTGI
jgi:hypothetical protein